MSMSIHNVRIIFAKLLPHAWREDTHRTRRKSQIVTAMENNDKKRSCCLQVAAIVNGLNGQTTQDRRVKVAEAKAEAEEIEKAWADAESAERVGRQLLAEEEQQRARVAAKKAKKQRQKAKKQQAHSVTPHVSESQSSDLSASGAHSSRSSSLNTDADVMKLFCCPITKVSHHTSLLQSWPPADATCNSDSINVASNASRLVARCTSQLLTL